MIFLILIYLFLGVCLAIPLLYLFRWALYIYIPDRTPYVEYKDFSILIGFALLWPFMLLLTVLGGIDAGVSSLNRHLANKLPDKVILGKKK